MPIAILTSFYNEKSPPSSRPFFAVCDELHEKVDATTQTKAQLIAKTWQMQGISGTVNANGLTVPIYTKGNTTNLADYSKYQLSLGSDGKFSLFDGQTQTGTWQLQSNDTQLQLTFSDATKTIYTVDAASATNLDLSYQVLPTTQNATEKGYLAQVAMLGMDASKGIKLSTKLIPQ